MKNLLIILLIGTTFIQCTMKNKQTVVDKKIISKEIISQTIKNLITKLGQNQKIRIEKGVAQVASLWRSKDGNKEEFETFCSKFFESDQHKLDQLFNRVSENFEALNGHLNRISLKFKGPTQLTYSQRIPIDNMFNAYNIYSHIGEDFYNNKIAFVIALNFPTYSLKEKEKLGKNWTRKQWAYARVGDMYTSRVPAKVIQNDSKAGADADAYISDYYIHMDKLYNKNNKTVFPKDMKLITHWGLRDEIKSNYSNKENGLEKQKMIYDVMKNIINQTIPKEVINKGEYNWNPTTNKLYKEGKEVGSGTPENTDRYQVLLNNFKAKQETDKFSSYDNFIQRMFDESYEIAQEDVEKLFTEFVSSPVMKATADLISKRLGRKLQPFDIWYDGFKARGTISQATLDAKVKAKYPTKDALQNDLKNILTKLDFDKKRAEFISSKVIVDPSRGAGHAWGAEMKNGFSHLRTHFTKDGLDYKGYNIATHEFGHNVEQTITIQDVDYFMMRGVPNTAFTEALAFLFQKRDLELLGIKDNNPNKKHLLTLDNLWGCFEIMSVSLVDMKVWKWLYANPNCTAQQLKEQVLKISIDVWNKYCAPIFGIKDQPILAIYSHMIEIPLYLSAYPLGTLIEFQLDEYMEGKSFGKEVERIYRHGRLTPQLWMKEAVGEELSIEPLLKAGDIAIKQLNK